MYIEKNIVCVLFIFFLSGFCAADTGKSYTETPGQFIYLAQNTTNNKSDSESGDSDEEFPPPPPVKISEPIKPKKNVSPAEKQPQPTKASDKNIPATTPPVQVKAVSPAQAKDDTVKVNTQAALQASPRKETTKAPQMPKIPLKLMEELSIYNVPTANLRTMKMVIDENYFLRSIVYGEEQGYIRILEADDEGNFTETWKSPPLNSSVRGLFVNDLDGDGHTEIVAYTSDGNIYIYGYENHTLIYKTPERTYQYINCMVIVNMDNDPQMELFFIGSKSGATPTQGEERPGNLIQFDTKSLFEEWISPDLYTATEMIVGNVDTDPEQEIILNSGEILGIRFKDVEWKSTINFGDRLYLIDLDNDGILELVTEYGESHIKIIDVDLRQEKW